MLNQNYLFLVLTLANTIHLTAMDIPRAQLLILHSAQEDVTEVEKIVHKIHNNIYPKATCKKALHLAFKQMRRDPYIQRTPWHEKQKINALSLVKEMWQIYANVELVDTQQASAMLDMSREQLRTTESNAAQDLVYAAMHLESIEKEKTVHSLRKQRLVLCSTLGIFIFLSIGTNLLTYYKSCP